MNKIAWIIVILAMIGSLAILFFSGFPNNSNPTETIADNVEIRDGIQYITITVRGGYSPQISQAQAHIPTKLVIKTNGTYDCSSSLVIRSLNYQKNLPPTGEEVIDITSPEVGNLQGTCGMGMYSFSVNFK